MMTRFLFTLLPALFTFYTVIGFAGTNPVEDVKKDTSSKINAIVQPLLDKYCLDHCKVLKVDTEVEVVVPEEVAPGFDEVSHQNTYELGPSSVKIQILIDEMVGPISRGKLLTLIQQYMSPLGYPVYIETKVTKFPQPLSSARKVTELKKKVEKKFRETLGELFNQFCPEQCMLADFEVQVDPVNAEEAQYGSSGEFMQEGDTAIRIRNIFGTLLLDETLLPEEKRNITEMAKLKTNYFRNVDLKSVSMKFPHPYSNYAGSTGLRYGKGYLGGLEQEKNIRDSKETSSKTDQKLSKSDSQVNRSLSSNNSNQSNSETTSQNQRQERYERFEKIERVEDGDAVQEELKKFGLIALVFGCAILAILIFIALYSIRKSSDKSGNPFKGVLQTLSRTEKGEAPAFTKGEEGTSRAQSISIRYQIENLIEELSKVFAENPKVAKQVFSRILTEEGVEITAHYIHIFGESVVLDILKDPSLQRDVAELTEYYAKNQLELDDEEKLELLKLLHNQTVSAKMVVFGRRSSGLFDFLIEMDALQTLELVRNESITVKAIVVTHCDPQKRTAIFSKLPSNQKMKLLNELSRIDHLPKDYIHNVAIALKRKRKENPRLNTESLPGSEVLVGLLEKTERNTQSVILQNIEAQSPESAQTIKSKLVSIDTLAFLRDSQLLEVILSLKHIELLQFLHGAPKHIRETIFSKSPKELVAELSEELENLGTLSRETYQSIERKVLNRVKIMANEGVINLVETNDRMFASPDMTSEIHVPTGQLSTVKEEESSIRGAAGW